MVRQTGGLVLVAVASATLGGSGCRELDRVAVPNTAPIAFAGADQDVAGGAQVTLAGSASDADGDPLALTWRQLSGDPVTLSSTTNPEITFTAPLRAQTLVLSLVATDGIDPSEASLVQVRVRFNRPPVADAGGPQEMRNLASLALDGSGSFDPDGDPVTYDWEVAAGPSGSTLGSLTGASTRYPVFTPDRKGSYTLTLVVSDGIDVSPADFALLVALNNPPTAQAGPDGVVQNLQPIDLAGTATDPDGDPVSFAWEVVTFPAGAAFTLSNADAATATFTPGGKGGYVLALTGNDGEESGAADTVIVQATNNPPTVNAGGDRTVVNLGQVGLAASAVDVDADNLTYLWEVVAPAPSGSSHDILGAATASPTFLPSGKGDYQLRVTVSDSSGASGSDTLTVTATNLAPAAVAIPSSTAVSTGEVLTLDGTASWDPDGPTPLSFAWSIRQGTASVVSGADEAAVTIRAGNVKETLGIELVVSDDEGVPSAPLLVNVVVDNNAPTAAAGADGLAGAGLPLQLDAAGSDDLDGGAALQYTWTCLSHPSLSFSPGNVVLVPTVSVTAPMAVGETLVFSLTVSDGRASSAAAVVSYEIIPSELTNVFVDAAASCGGACDGSRAAPFTSIGAAATLGSGLPMLAAAGTYGPTTIPSGLSLTGGCDAIRWRCDGSAGDTVIAAGPADQVALTVSGSATQSGVIERLTVVGGTGGGLGDGFLVWAVRCHTGCRGIFRDMRIEGGGAPTTHQYGYGMEVNSTSGPVRIEDVAVYAGRAAFNVGLLVNSVTDLQVTGSLITTLIQARATTGVDVSQNNAVLLGGPSSNLLFERNELIGQGDATIGRAHVILSAGSHQATFAGNLIWQRATASHANDGERTNAAVVLDSCTGGSVTFVNNTFLGNQSAWDAGDCSAGDQWGVCAAVALNVHRDQYSACPGGPSGTHYVVNNYFEGFRHIVDASRTSTGLSADGAARLAMLSNTIRATSCFSWMRDSCHGGVAVLDAGNHGAVATGGSGNLVADCLLTSYANGDWHLLASSPCAGSGVSYPSAPLFDMDIDADPRPSPVGSNIDRGADEVN